MGLIPKSNLRVKREIRKGKVIAGKYQPGPCVYFVFKGNVQPTSGRELFQMPESDRIKESVSVWSDFNFQINDILTDIETGKIYEVQKVENWSRFKLKHNKIIALLRDNQNDDL